MIDRMLFCHYYSSYQQLSFDNGMISTKNRLAIKQYICDKPVRFGIKSFLLCEAKTGYKVNVEIYTGRVKSLSPSWISRQCCPLSLGELTVIQQEPCAVHRSFLQLRHALPPAEERTGGPDSGHRHAKP